MFISLVSQTIILINTQLNSEKEVIQNLWRIQGVKEVFWVYGIYDIIVMIEASTQEKLKEKIVNEVRRVDGIRNTLSLIVVEDS